MHAAMERPTPPLSCAAAAAAAAVLQFDLQGCFGPEMVNPSQSISLAVMVQGVAYFSCAHCYEHKPIKLHSCAMRVAIAQQLIEDSLGDRSPEYDIGARRCKISHTLIATPTYPPILLSPILATNILLIVSIK